MRGAIVSPSSRSTTTNGVSPLPDATTDATGTPAPAAARSTDASSCSVGAFDRWRMSGRPSASNDHVSRDAPPESRRSPPIRSAWRTSASIAARSPDMAERSSSTLDRMERVKVAAVQGTPVFLDREATVEEVGVLTAKAAAEGAGLVVFPETFVPTYPDWVWRTRPWDGNASALYARLLDQAVTVPSPATEALGQAAADAGAYLSVGVDELDPASTTLFNTQLLFGPDGALLLAHR